MTTEYAVNARSRTQAAIKLRLEQCKKPKPLDLEGWVRMSPITSVLEALKRKLGVQKIELKV